MVVKTTRITIETESLMIVRRAQTVRTWCPNCQADVEVMVLNGTSLAEDIPAAQLQNWLANGRLHFWSSPDGSTKVCLTSLLRCFESEDDQQTRIPERTLTIEGEGQ